MNLPSEREINPHPGCLDGDYAVKMFLGKSLEQAEALFRENGLARQEDLMWMGPVGFVYYFPAALRYLQGPDSADDADFASAMTGLMEFRVLGAHQDYEQIRDARHDMILFCEHLLARYEDYGVDAGLYGDLRPRLNHLLDHLERDG